MGYYYSSNNYIAHHGIKGQKWGVRRFQNKDGSLTPAGKKRYDGPSKKQYKIPENKSSHRVRLEGKYAKEGLSKEQAEQAAARRIRAEKIVAGAAMLTVAAVVGYGKYKNYSTDKILNADTRFQRIARSIDGNMRVQDAYYMSYKDKDNKRYADVFTRELEERLGKDKDIYKFTGKAEKEMKIASPKRARETFAKLYKENKEFRDTLNKTDLFDANKGRMNYAKLKGKAYYDFNKGLVDKSPEAKKAATMFYEKLKEQGMNAVRDEVDIKNRRYKTKDPLIVFDNNVNWKGTKISTEEIAKNYEAHMKKEKNKGNVKTVVELAGIMGTSAKLASKLADKMLDNQKNNEFIQKYRQEHPNSKLSDKDILALM